MSKKSKPHQLLVEGKNDRHVIWSLCNQYQLPEEFSVEVPVAEGTEGIEVLLDGLPLKLKEKNLKILGIVVDADRDLVARWQGLRDRLRESGYQDVPNASPNQGWVYSAPELPKVGVWLMPNNQLPGMLEDFVACLIPTDDKLLPKAQSVLQEIEQSNINRYTLIHRPKALIHTWLAWQEKPGMPMGQAITAKVLNSNSQVAIAFIEWLKLLFNLP
ncbi:hypothetical protein F7734_44305 [Scytonema sp. UIC 10036]|uniref:DUF3226 domain-containing protein n=1 Tax=Scytonema sp. UIC 10036 TaxID=2304196 RepID=UPI0012DAED3A|nr:DUF3226 domain-containing protein [Scytonema sp. UIC 10036]MUG98947.1 hypothetical protein [Scytonema sp. UIC 10036]